MIHELRAKIHSEFTGKCSMKNWQVSTVFHSQTFKHPPTSFCPLKSKGMIPALQNATLMLIWYHYNYFTATKKPLCTQLCK